MTTKKEFMQAIDETLKNIAKYAIEQNSGNPLTACTETMTQHYHATAKSFQEVICKLYPSKMTFVPYTSLYSAIEAVTKEWDSLNEFNDTIDSKGTKIVRLVSNLDAPQMTTMYKVYNNLGRVFYFKDHDSAKRCFMEQSSKSH